MKEDEQSRGLSRRQMMVATVLFPAGSIKTAKEVNLLQASRPPRFYNVRDWGARGDGIADDLPAVSAALRELARATPVLVGGDNLTAPSGTIYFPPGRYFLSRTLSLKQQIRLLGETRGLGGGAATTLEFPPNVTGILINRHNTDGQTGTSSSGSGADGSALEGIAVRARPGARAGSGATGIYARARCALLSSQAEGFARDGIALVAEEDGELLGNANGSTIRDCTVQGNGRHGLLISGNNANACIIENLNSVYNGGYGFFDATAVGQSWIGGHSASNGQLDSGLYPSTSIVWHQSAIYAVMPGRAEAARRIPPGRDPTVWSLRERGAGPFPNIPPWRRGMAITEGGAGFIGSGRHVLINPYTEGRQGPLHLGGGMAFGGVSGAGFTGRGLHIYESEGALISTRAAPGAGPERDELCGAIGLVWSRFKIA